MSIEDTDENQAKRMLSFTKTAGIVAASALFMAVRYIPEPESPRSAEQRAALAVHEATCLFHALGLVGDDDAKRAAEKWAACGGEP